MNNYFFTGVWNGEVYASVPFQSIDDQQAVVDAHRLYDRFVKEWEADSFMIHTLEIGGIDTAGNCETTFARLLWDSNGNPEQNIILTEESRNLLYPLSEDPEAINGVETAE